MISLPWLPIYNIVTALLLTAVLGILFFSSVFLYNRLCEKELLALRDDVECFKISRWYEFLIFAVSCIGVSSVFCFLIFSDAFDISLIIFLPPLLVAIFCELKNGFVPLISVVLCGLSVLCRVLFYCVFHGFGFGLSILLSFLFSFIPVFLPKIIFQKKNVESVDIFFIITFALIASYFSPIYSLIFTLSVYLSVALFYVLPNYISKKKRGLPIFRFKVPYLLVASVVFCIMLFI